MTTVPVPKAIIFDWDSTLADGWKAILAAYNLTRCAMGLDPWDEETARANIRRSWRDAFPIIFGDRWEEAGKIYYEQFGKIHHQYLEPIHGAFELLELLQQKNIFAAIVSNKRGPYLREEVEYLNWQGYFKNIIGAMDAPRDKPHPEPVFMALQGSGLKPGADVWFVGDTGVDIQCAYNTGCTAVLVNGAHLKPGELDDMPPAKSFVDIVEMVEYLEKIL